MIPFSTYESRYGLIFKTRCEYIPVRLVHPLSLRMTVLTNLSGADLDAWRAPAGSTPRMAYIKINPHLHLDTE